MATVDIDAEGHASVSFAPWMDGTGAQLTVRYGEHVATALVAEPPAVWELDLGFRPDSAGSVTMLFISTGDGRAFGAWALALPSGPFAAG